MRGKHRSASAPTGAGGQKRLIAPRSVTLPTIVATPPIVHSSVTSGQVWREWLTVAGTVGATAAAVYVGVLRGWLRAPKLSLEPSDDVPSDRRIVGSPEDPLAFVRSRVVASPRRQAAEDVEVMILDSKEIKARQGANHEPSLRLEGMLLKWGTSNRHA